MDNCFISRFWENYIVKLNTYGVKPKGARWYVRHAEQYLRTFPDWCLATHTVQDVEQYLQDKGRKAGLEDWQFQQMVKALQVLFIELVKASWATDFSCKIGLMAPVRYPRHMQPWRVTTTHPCW